MIYKWKDQAHIKIDAQAAGEEMERIRIRHNGRLESPMLVEAARDEASPLHPAFEWDDVAAAQAYRVEQAGHLIRSIVVNIERPDGETAPIRAFVSVKRDDDRSYTSIAHAMADDDLRSQVLAQAMRELVAWRDRYAELAELGELFARIDQARGAE